MRKGIGQQRKRSIESAWRSFFIAFFSDFPRSRPVFVGSMVYVQSILRRLGMRMVAFGKCRFFLGMMRDMGLEVLFRVMLRLLEVPLPLLAGT